MRDAYCKLPPDPEGMNDVRATWAKQALLQFIINTGTDWADSLGDLLANLMHLCDSGSRTGLRALPRNCTRPLSRGNEGAGHPCLNRRFH